MPWIIIFYSVLNGLLKNSVFVNILDYNLILCFTSWTTESAYFELRSEDRDYVVSISRDRRESLRPF